MADNLNSDKTKSNDINLNSIVTDAAQYGFTVEQDNDNTRDYAKVKTQVKSKTKTKTKTKKETQAEGESQHRLKSTYKVPMQPDIITVELFSPDEISGNRYHKLPNQRKRKITLLKSIQTFFAKLIGK